MGFKNSKLKDLVNIIERIKKSCDEEEWESLLEKDLQLHHVTKEFVESEYCGIYLIDKKFPVVMASLKMNDVKSIHK